MSRLLSLCAALLAWSAGAASAVAAPPSDGKTVFGIPMGAPIAKVAGARGFKPGWYHVAAPPSPDSRFEQVAVEAFAATGVCVVQGVGREVRGDPEGAQIRQAIDRLADDFSTLYGTPEKLDACSGFACAPATWGEDLQTGDRRYGYRWAVRAGAIREVSVVAIPHSVSSFVYLVQFDGPDLTRCRYQELRTPEG